MPIKYNREDSLDQAREARQTPWMRQGPVAPRMTRRHTLFVFAGFLASAALLGQLAARRAARAPYTGRPVMRGVGTVIGKERLAGGGGLVRLEVTLESGTVLAADGKVPDPFWEPIRAGDRLSVIYQTNHLASILHVIECGIVALPGEIR